MRLAQFITTRMEAILKEWEIFALTLLPASERMSSLTLRDHAGQILAAVAIDLSTSQTGDEQAEKSKGRAPQPLGVVETAAQTHAVLRASCGFDINQLAAEYRALRASVLRLWIKDEALDAQALEDIIRFNEAIDQALAESVSSFSTHMERARDLLLGMLGHDMRNPINAVQLTAHHLASLNAGDEISDAANVLIRCGASITALLDDLVDFNRTQLGLGIVVNVADVDLEPLFAAEIEQGRAANPGRKIEWAVQCDTKGRWDGARLRQVLRNLVSNAIKYGAKDEPVWVSLTGNEDTITLQIKNRGPAIEPLAFEQIFEPLKRGVVKGDESFEDGLGLGLYIVREVVRAHNGKIDLRSDGEGTVFAVQLPRWSEIAPKVTRH